MTAFEKAIERARLLDKLHPQFSHVVGLRLNIVRIKNLDKRFG